MTPVPVRLDLPGHGRVGRVQENKPFAKDRSDGVRDIPGKREAPSRKERSLSPYSKRIALTQAMNMGR